MMFTPNLLPALIEAVKKVIDDNSDEVTALDQAIGDGDHVVNLQRGLSALMEQRHDLVMLDWSVALQKIGMTMMTTVGGASGSLYGTLFMTMSKAVQGQVLTTQGFASAFSEAVESVKRRGKADVGEKTMLDVLIPVAEYLNKAVLETVSLTDMLKNIPEVAIQGMESTRDMLATKGRASFLEARSLGHIDAGAKTSQLMICACVSVLSTAPA